MTNPVLILTRNNLALTKRCVESVHNQDIETSLLVLDNGSTDGTIEWLRSGDADASWMANEGNEGVSRGWNTGLQAFFGWPDRNHHCLVIGNDTLLSPFFYRELLSYPHPFVTGFAVESMDDLREPTEQRTEPHPDFSAFLIRRACWEKVGLFDETMVSWASDCDYHVRAHQCGMEAVKVPVPFYHVRSSTLRLAPTEEQRSLHEQANKDRARFHEKWGTIPGQPEYAELFK